MGKKCHNLIDLKNVSVGKRLVVASGEQDEGGMVWKSEIGRCKLSTLYIRRINNKVLSYSTGNYIQYALVNHNGKEYEKNMYK